MFLLVSNLILCEYLTALSLHEIHITWLCYSSYLFCPSSAISLIYRRLYYWSQSPPPPKLCCHLGDFSDCRMAHLTWTVHGPSLGWPFNLLLHPWPLPLQWLTESPQLCWPNPHELMAHIFKWTPLFSGFPITSHSSCLPFLHVPTVSTSSHSPQKS